MSSLIATATSAFISTLTGAAGVPTVSRIKLRPLSATTTSAVVVRPVQTEVAEASLAPGHPIQWQTTIAVECYARATLGTAPDNAVDAVISAVYAALMTDPTLGNQVVRIAPQTLVYEFDADADNTVAAIFQFSVRQRATPAIF